MLLLKTKETMMIVLDLTGDRKERLKKVKLHFIQGFRGKKEAKKRNAFD